MVPPRQGVALVAVLTAALGLGRCSAGLPWRQLEAPEARSCAAAADASDPGAFAAPVSAQHPFYVRTWARAGEELEARLYQRLAQIDRAFSASLVLLGPRDAARRIERHSLRPFGADEILEEQFDRPAEAWGRGTQPARPHGYKVWRPLEERQAVADPFLPRADVLLARAKFTAEAEGWHYWIAVDMTHTTRGCQVARGVDAAGPEASAAAGCAAHVIVDVGPDVQAWGFGELLGHPAFAEPLHRWEAVDGAAMALPAMLAAALTFAAMWYKSRRWNQTGDLYIDDVLVSDALLAPATAFFLGSATYRAVMLLVFLSRGLFGVVDCMLVVLLVLLQLTVAAITAGSWAHVRYDLSFSVSRRAVLGLASFAAFFCFGAGVFMGPILGMTMAALPEETTCSVMPYAAEANASVRQVLRRFVRCLCCAPPEKEEDKALASPTSLSPGETPTGKDLEAPQIPPTPKVVVVSMPQATADCDYPAPPPKSAGGIGPRPPSADNERPSTAEDTFKGLHPAPTNDPLRNLLNQWCEAFAPMPGTEPMPQAVAAPAPVELARHQQAMPPPAQQMGPGPHPFALPQGPQTPTHSSEASTPQGSAAWSPPEGQLMGRSPSLPPLRDTSPGEVARIPATPPRSPLAGRPHTPAERLFTDAPRMASSPVLPPLQLPGQGGGAEIARIPSTPPRTPPHEQRPEMGFPAPPGHGGHKAGRGSQHKQPPPPIITAPENEYISPRGSPAFGGTAASYAPPPQARSPTMAQGPPMPQQSGGTFFAGQGMDQTLLQAAQRAAEAAPPPPPKTPPEGAAGVARIPACPLPFPILVAGGGDRDAACQEPPQPCTRPPMSPGMSRIPMRPRPGEAPAAAVPPPPATPPDDDGGAVPRPATLPPLEGSVVFRAGQAGEAKPQEQQRPQFPVFFVPKADEGSSSPSHVATKPSSDKPAPPETAAKDRAAEAAPLPPPPPAPEDGHLSKAASPQVATGGVVEGPRGPPAEAQKSPPEAPAPRPPSQQRMMTPEDRERLRAAQSGPLVVVDVAGSPAKGQARIDGGQPLLPPQQPQPPSDRPSQRRSKGDGQASGWQPQQQQLQQQQKQQPPQQPQQPTQPQRPSQRWNPLQPQIGFGAATSGARPDATSQSPPRRTVLPPVKMPGMKDDVLAQAAAAALGSSPPPPSGPSEATPPSEAAPRPSSARSGRAVSPGPSHVGDQPPVDPVVLRAQAMARKISVSPRNQPNDLSGKNMPEMAPLTRPSVPGRRNDPRPPGGAPEPPSPGAAASLVAPMPPPVAMGEASPPPPPSFPFPGVAEPCSPQAPEPPRPLSARSTRSRGPRTPTPLDQSQGLSLDFQERRN